MLAEINELRGVSFCSSGHMIDRLTEVLYYDSRRHSVFTRWHMHTEFRGAFFLSCHVCRQPT